MKKLYFLDEEEKNRILNSHENATKRLYLSEQIKKGMEGDPYEYRKENGKYYYRNIQKGEINWIEANPTQSTSIETNIFKTNSNNPVNNIKQTTPKTDVEYLLFDGNYLKWVKNGKVIKSWKAVSGRTKFNTFGDKAAEQAVKKYGGKNTEFMKVKEQGPIPVGNYTISQVQKRTNGNATQFMQGKSQKQLYNLMMVGNKHEWNGGEPADLIAWGDYRLPITKSGETETFGRGSFYIHGGGIPGSIGCIDLTTGMNDFAIYFENWKTTTKNKIMKLVVKY
jgi:hypothetical protein